MDGSFTYSYNGNTIDAKWSFLTADQWVSMLLGTLDEQLALDLWNSYYAGVLPPETLTGSRFTLWFNKYFGNYDDDIFSGYFAEVYVSIIVYDTATAINDYNVLLTNCYTLCNREVNILPTRCEEFENAFIAELRPGGFYGAYDHSTYNGSDNNSILSDNNIFNFDYTSAAVNYLDDNGVPYPAGQGPRFMSKQAFVMNFKESWSKAIFAWLQSNNALPAEAQCFLNLCSTDADVFEYEAYLQSAMTYDHALKLLVAIDDSFKLLQPISTYGSALYQSPSSGMGTLLHDPLESHATIGPLLSSFMQNVDGTSNTHLYDYAIELARPQSTTTFPNSMGTSDCFKDREWRIFRDAYLTKRMELINDHFMNCGLTSGLLPDRLYSIMTSHAEGSDTNLANQMTTPAGRQSFYDQNILAPCESNCEDLASQWLAQLDLSAMTNLADTTPLKAHFVALCKASCSETTPYGASTLPATEDTVFIDDTPVDIIPTFIPITVCSPPGQVQVSSFGDILDAYETCGLLTQGPGMNPYLIESVDGYRDSIAYPILDVCGCDKVALARLEFDNLKAANDLPVGVASPNGYFAHKYGVWLNSFSEAECACNQAGANVTDLNIPVPEGVGCSECFECDSLLDKYTDFYQEVFGTTTYSIGGEGDDYLYELFSNYLKVHQESIQAESGALTSYVKECHMAKLGWYSPYGLSPHAQNLITLLNYLKDETGLADGTEHTIPLYHDYYRSSLYPHPLTLNSEVDATISHDLGGNGINIYLQNTSTGGIIKDTIDITAFYPVGGIPNDESDVFSFDEFWVNMGSPRANGDAHKCILVATNTGSSALSIAVETSYPMYRRSQKPGNDILVTICPDRYNGMENENPCLDMIIENTMAEVVDELIGEIDAIRDAFVQDYKGQCKLLEENYKLVYDANEYNASLYYYSADGNLVQTISPNGVVNGAPATHSYKTQYRYNTLNQMVEAISPDAGRNRFWYNSQGQLVLSQNAEQRTVQTQGSLEYSQYSYTRYDDLGRIVEIGQLNAGVAYDPQLAAGSTLEDLPAEVQQAIVDQVSVLADLDQTINGTQVTVWNYMSKEQVTSTYYSDDLSPKVAGYFGSEPRMTLGRVSSVTVEENSDGDAETYDYGIHFAYDIHGNVTRVINENTELEFLGQSLKEIRYSYELLSGNVNEVQYQAHQLDAKYHRYLYDQNNRIHIVETSTDGVIWQEDAKYEYYLHGPLARTEVGEQKVQGLDYVYNLQGWIKAMNSNSLQGANDPGKDGELGTAYNSDPDIHRQIANDVFGYVVDYYQGDYKAIDGTKQNFAATHGGSYQYNNGGITSLYNGNIAAYSPGITDLNNDPLDAYGRAYRYDQLNRLKSQQAHKTGNDLASNTWTSAAATNEFKVELIYDANGNIESLLRNAHGNTPAMDDITYTYANGKNQLTTISDAEGLKFGSDIKASGTGGSQFVYNKIGQVINNSEDEIAHIEWNLDGMITHITRTPNSEKPDIEFRYDPLGNRIAKIVKPRIAGSVSDIGHWDYTYYVNDISGDNMAIYETDMAEDGSYAWFTLDYQFLCNGRSQPLTLQLSNGGTNGNLFNGILLCGRDYNMDALLTQFFTGEGFTVTKSGDTYNLFKAEGWTWSNPVLTVCIGGHCYTLELQVSSTYQLDYKVSERGIYGSKRVGVDKSTRLLAESEMMYLENDVKLNDGDIGKRRLYVTGTEMDITFAGSGTMNRITVYDGANNYMAHQDNLSGTTASMANAFSNYVNLPHISQVLSDDPNTARFYSDGIQWATNGGYIEYTASADLFIRASALDELQRFRRGSSEMGRSAYELSNYLGNVNNVISNRALFQRVDNLAVQEDVDSYTLSNQDYAHQNMAYDNSTGTIGSSTTGAYFKTDFPFNLGSGATGQDHELTFDLIVNGVVELTLYDNQGTTLQTETYSNTSGTKTVVVNVPGIHLGVRWELVSGSSFSLNNILIQTINRFKLAEVLQYQDYYPFGMPMPGRKGWSGSGHRFGFQNQEVDNEIAGNGNSIGYRYRMHDPRLGRFFAVDPLSYFYPWNSPYAFSENRVIDGIELEGLERVKPKFNDPYKKCFKDRARNTIKFQLFEIDVFSEFKVKKIEKDFRVEFDFDSDAYTNNSKAVTEAFRAARFIRKTPDGFTVKISGSTMLSEGDRGANGFINGSVVASFTAKELADARSERFQNSISQFGINPSDMRTGDPIYDANRAALITISYSKRKLKTRVKVKFRPRIWRHKDTSGPDSKVHNRRKGPKYRGRKLKGFRKMKRRQNKSKRKGPSF
ncbi:hypothetical protein KFE98_16080 [bacterium SCSIO 12741]|nr:hypothetical protein KFE98_16080 [bacterium SCSIO 12741]